jgi:DNA-binding MarR family transcriptional regulator
MLKISISEFADRLNEILPVLIREFAKRQAGELYKGKITMPQFIILDFLNKRGPLKMSDVARFMGVSTAATTGIIDRLVKCGYIKRAHEPNDRRIIKIKSTSKGMELTKRINSQRHKMIINIFSKLSSTERNDYLRVLMRIRDILIQRD